MEKGKGKKWEKENLKFKNFFNKGKTKY